MICPLNESVGHAQKLSYIIHHILVINYRQKFCKKTQKFHIFMRHLILFKNETVLFLSNFWLNLIFKNDEGWQKGFTRSQMTHMYVKIINSPHL